jgi:hypothetical protein
MARDVPPPQPGPGPGTDGQPDRDARVLVLAEYMRGNRDAFTEEALRRAAADNGYDPREIDAAWAVSAEPVRGRTATGKAFLIVVGYFVGVFVVATILAAIPEASILALPAIGVGLVGAVFAWLTLRDSNPPLAEAFRIAVIILVVVPVILLLVGLGVCVVLIVGFRAA